MLGAPRRLTALAPTALAAVLAACGGGGGSAPSAAPVVDHVHAAVPGHATAEILLGTHFGLRISEDGGTTWPPAGDLAHARLRLLIAAGSGYVAVAARDDGSSQTLWSGDGRRWHPATGMPSGRPVSALVAGSSPGTVWAEVAGVGIYGSGDGGHGWHPVLPTPLAINDLAAGVDGPGLFAYASSSGLFLATGPELVPLFDAPVLEGDVQTVHHWHACPRCLVATLTGSVATSSDGGRHWTEHPCPAPVTDVLSWAGGGASLLAVAPAPASPAHGLYLSTDSGATWRRLLDAPLIDHLHLPPATGAPLYAFGWGVEVYRSDDGGRSWTDTGRLRG